MRRTQKVRIMIRVGIFLLGWAIGVGTLSSVQFYRELTANTHDVVHKH